MKLLDFGLRPYTRKIFADKTIKAKWEEKLIRGAEAYRELETLSVEKGLRDIAVLTLREDRFTEFASNYAKKGLTLIPIRKVRKQRGGFTHKHEKPNPGEPFNYFSVLTKDPKKAHEFYEAMQNENGIDNDKIGELLGYPKCCRNFFSEQWGKHLVDPIWQQSENTSSEYVPFMEDTKAVISKDLSYISNVLLRPIGVRLIPHIPCSHDCQESLQLGEEFLRIGREENVEGLDDLVEILKLPVEWSALKAIAYLSTPVFKIEYNSVPCYPEYIVQREGTFYPEESPNGLKFPWTERFKINGSKIDQAKREGKIKEHAGGVPKHIQALQNAGKSCGCGGNCQCSN